MRKTLFQIVLLTVVCILVVVANSASFAAVDKNAKALAALDEEWSKAAEARNAELVASYYADDAVVYPPNEPAVTGRAAIKDSWAKALADPKAKLSWKTTDASVSNGLGFTAGTYEVSDGTKTMEKGKYLCVWRKGSDGKWKAVHDMWNSDSK